MTEQDKDTRGGLVSFGDGGMTPRADLRFTGNKILSNRALEHDCMLLKR